jgi:hypothetical protein
MPTLLSILRAEAGGAWAVRCETIKTLGILGALDPTVLKSVKQIESNVNVPPAPQVLCEILLFSANDFPTCLISTLYILSQFVKIFSCSDFVLNSF